jgi:hypothetical protein
MDSTPSELRILSYCILSLTTSKFIIRNIILKLISQFMKTIMLRKSREMIMMSLGFVAFTGTCYLWHLHK